MNAHAAKELGLPWKWPDSYVVLKRGEPPRTIDHEHIEMHVMLSGLPYRLAHWWANQLDGEFTTR